MSRPKAETTPMKTKVAPNGHSALAEAPAEELRPFFELSLDLLCIAGPDGYFKRLNPAFEATLGWSTVELLAKPLLDFVHPDDVPATQIELAKLAQGHAPFHFEHRFRCKDGAYKWLAWTIRPTADLLYATARDVTKAKQNEATLRESEALYKTLFDNAPVAIFTKNKEGVYTSLNKDTLKYWPQNPLGRTDLDLLEPEIGQALHANDLQVMATGQEMVAEETVYTHAGVHVVLSRKLPTYDAAGNVSGVLGISVDITERKRIEEALARERNLMRTLIDTIPDYIYAKDSQGRFTLLNMATARLLGVTTPDEAIGKSDFDFFPPDMASQFYADEQALLRSGQPLLDHEEQVLDQTTQQEKWNLTNKVPLKDELGHMAGLVGINRDITQVKRAQEAAQESQRMLQLVLDNVSQRVFWKDKDLVYLGCNKLFAGDAGLSSPADIIGRRDTELSWKEQAELYNADDRLVMEQAEPKINYEEPQTTPTGQQIWLQTSKIPLKNDEGEIIGILGTYADISQQKRLEEQVQVSLQRRERQVRVATSIAQEIALASNSTDLFQRIVDRIREQFGFYHVQLYRYEPADNSLSLSAGYGEIGKQIVKAGRQILVGQGLLGTAAAFGETFLRSGFTQEPDWQPHPLLPATKDELVVPIRLGHQDAQAQVLALQGFIQNNFAGFIVCPTEPEVIAPVVKTALDQGLKVITQSHDLGPGNQTSYVGAAEYETGYQLGQQAGEWAKTHLPAGATLNVGVLNHRAIPGVVQREEGIIAGIQATFGPNMVIVANEFGSNPVLSLPVTERWLQEYPQLQMIVGINDAGALGAYQALKAVGKNDPERFFIGGVDGVDEALAAIAEGGAYQATVDKSARVEAVAAVRALVAAIAGRPGPERTMITTRPVNRANLTEFLAGRSLVQEADDLAGLDLAGLKIGLSVMSLYNPFFAAFAQVAAEEAKRLGLELVVNDPKTLLGVLDIQLDQVNGLDQEDQLALEGLSGQIAVAIENARLFQQTQQEIKERQQAEAQLEARLQELSALQRLLSREGWQAYQASRQDAPDGYQFDQTALYPITPESSWPSQANGHHAGPVVSQKMAVHGEVIGVLGIQDDPNNPLSLEDQEFLAAISEQVAEALERSRLLEQSQKRAVELETVAMVSAQASTELRLETLLQTVVDLTISGFGLYHAHIYLLDETGETLNLAAGAGEVGRQMLAKKWSIPLNHPNSIVASTACTRQPVMVNNVQEAPYYLPNPLLPHTRSELAIPLLVGEQLLGVLDVQADQPNHFTPADAQIQTTLASQVATALQNARLFAEQKQARQLLNKRVKETDCLNDISREIDDTPPIDQFLAWVAQRIPAAMQYPALCRVAIEYNGRTFGVAETVNLPYQMTHALRMSNQVVGRIYIAYTEKQDFLNEESALLGGIARRVNGYIDNRRLLAETQAALAETESLYTVSRRLNQAGDLNQIVAAIAQGMAIPMVNRVILSLFEWDSRGELAAMSLAATWYSGQGTLPMPVGTRYARETFSSIGILLTSEPIFIEDSLQDERVDPAMRQVLQRLSILSLVVVPLWAGSRQLGALLFEAEEPHHFNEYERRSLMALGQQTAVAVENQRLLAETQAALAQVEATQRRYTVQAWESYLARNKPFSYEQVREGVRPLGDELLPQINQAIALGRQTSIQSHSLLVTPAELSDADNPDNNIDASLIMPLAVRGQTIGVLGLQETEAGQGWSEEEIALIEAVARHIAEAAENLRLVDETQQRAARERRVNEIGDKIQAAQSLEEALQIAIEEVGLSLQSPQTTVELAVK